MPWRLEAHGRLHRIIKKPRRSSSGQLSTEPASATTAWTPQRKRDASLPELGPMGAPR
ncbi:hypothetical protein M427DRAFT_459270 [Gonapodya prolifera JEL478]|uniref:Uncharacterized protein n=1 Tax=Gonapodya prolifera (strain JEL478) TaxID=1344416 RepID=A0A139A2Y2_GONPJ|nr:hypothetical protein M427DRAFT_459270 [Gonapodya prolifera JEL478]|eukprot:KXS10875.1 hypothetical protein M427DRAFT_459270 [Gonapodya prolifera JEL478]